MFIATVVIAIVFALMLVFSGVGKLRHDPKQMGVMTEVGFPEDKVGLLALAEFAGAIGPHRRPVLVADRRRSSDRNLPLLPRRSDLPPTRRRQEHRARRRADARLDRLHRPASAEHLTAISESER
ncbi:DoxX family protein [Gordonia sputi]